MTEADIAQQLERIPYAKTLGVAPNVVGDEFTLILPFNQDNIGNPFLPALHGGVIGGFLEIAAIAQVLLESDGKKFPKPIGINVDYLRSGKPQDLFARARITKLGSRVANVRVRAWQSNFDEPVATLHGHFLMTEDSDAA